MFSFFSPSQSPAPVTRFEKSHELRELANIIKALRKKEDELKVAKEANGAGSVDYKKFTVVRDLLSSLNAAIEKFNALPIPEDSSNDLNEMIKLTDEMKHEIANIRLQGRLEILALSRDMKRNAITKTVDFGSFATLVTTVYSAPVSILGKVGLWLGGSALKASVMHATGLDIQNTRSTNLLLNLEKTLDDIHENLCLDVGLNNDQADESASDAEDGALHCYSPITESYIDSLRRKDQQPSEMIEAMELTAEEQLVFADFLDPLLSTVMNIPVRVGDACYDLDSILKVDPAEAGVRKDPITRYAFYPRDIQPARDIYQKITSAIDAMKAKRAQSYADNPSEVSSQRLRR